MTEVRKNQKQNDFRIELLVVFAILISLGFPGNFTRIYGNKLGTVMEYGAFFTEILAMLLSSGDSWLDVRIINLDKKYIMLYLFIAAVFIESMMVTRYPTEEVVSCTRLCVTAFFAIWLQEQFEFMHMLELIGMGQVLYVLSNIVFMVRYPWLAYASGSTFTHALQGLCSAKNTLASELSFGILVVAFIVKKKIEKKEDFKGWMVFLGIQIILIVMCQATGAILCTLLALVPLFLPKNIRLPLGWGYIAGNIVFLFGTLVLMPYFEWFFEAIGKDATLTGRIPLWNRIIEVMMGHRTLTGYGYAMFWRDPKAYRLIQQGFHKWSSLSQITSGAHNTLLELWLNVGLIGIACFFLMVLYAMRDIKEVVEAKYYFSSMVLVYFLITGLTERCFGGTYDYKMLIIFLILAICSNRPVKGISVKAKMEAKESL